MTPSMTPAINAPEGVRATGVQGAFGRVLLVAGVGLIEAIVISFFYDSPRSAIPPSAVIGFVWHFAAVSVQAAILAIGAFAILNWHRRVDLLRNLQTSSQDHKFSSWLASNVCVFIATVAASIAVCSSMEVYTRWLWPYFALLALLGVTLMLSAAPIKFWRQMLAATWMSAILAIVAAILVLAFSALSTAGWVPLAGATLHVTHALLSLYESDVLMDIATKRLGVGNFMVEISPACSGYEGIGLVTAVLSLYLYVFRRELRFPHALFLIPIGIAAIWLLNAVRIAALVSFGAHFSPQVAVGGFHSQAGWIAFLIVSVSVMVLGQQVGFFRKFALADGNGSGASTLTTDKEGDALAWLAPFMALMTASIIASAFAPNDQWLYGLRVIFIAAALWVFRSFYATMAQRVAPASLAAGLAVGVAWIATDPNPAASAELGNWILALPLWAAALWLVIRAAGTIVFVPIAEELAFRGFLHRAIASQRFANATPLMMTVIAFVVTSLLFGAIHQRWLAGMLAGAVYALVMYRTGRMSDPIGAHMASNAVIIAWAITQQQWSLI
ncbi:MAG: exosortase E/protease, VPEID-CTERM system [Hyphomicrobiaceae bacterium]|nr:exosortase E/protease, VPEID-CTERM system [Hyphomicrobiaceae bacterium]